MPFPHPGGAKLANLTNQTLFGLEGLNMADGALVVRDKYLAGSWKEEEHWNKISTVRIVVQCPRKLIIFH